MSKPIKPMEMLSIQNHKNNQKREISDQEAENNE